MEAVVLSKTQQDPHGPRSEGSLLPFFFLLKAILAMVLRLVI